MTIKALVVDDSAFMRKAIKDILNSDQDIEVIATACNGEDAIEKIETLKPDVVALDNVMPGLNGLDALEYIMSKCPTPVVMLTSADPESADISLTAFEYGAVEFITKPPGQISPDILKMKDEIIQKVKAASQVDVKKLNFIRKKPQLTTQTSRHLQYAKGNSYEKIVAIGSSTGGPSALEQVIPNLPADLNAAVLVIQHMPAGFTRTLAERLDAHSKLKVKEASEGDQLQSGLVLLAPGGYHMEIIQQNGSEVVALNKKPKQNGVRPSVDVTYQSILPLKKQIISVILTGMGSDGAKGAHEIRKAGGKVIAEDKSTCVVYGMPKSVIEQGDADIIAPIHEVADRIVELVEERW
jgi:two-component system chemotaxis response regulator CheB